LIAGLNAAARAKGLPAFELGRNEAYTGILVDDLINKGADEPYRMFTSRAEFRLHLRIDNADERLTPHGRALGLVDDRRWELFTSKRQQKTEIVDLLGKTRTSAVLDAIGSLASTDNPTLLVWLRRPEARIEELSRWIEARLGAPLQHGLLTTIETETKYEGYLAQQERQIVQLKASENRRIPNLFSYDDIPGLSNEVRQKLTRVQPQTLGQASRIPGVTPAAVGVLDVFLGLRSPSQT